ncbi:hypothetical protein THOM_0384 [Trachipleistophora hominis]|uniref:Uncharacterized protein n=1 Tax=Trachipleistophora hominis TaxID=72359 RepID=L7JZE4_TRAHO|nr:hypothetical protein THOM_0384 [Trachipleistophora hominis]
MEPGKKINDVISLNEMLGRKKKMFEIGFVMDDNLANRNSLFRAARYGENESDSSKEKKNALGCARERRYREYDRIGCGSDREMNKYYGDKGGNSWYRNDGYGKIDGAARRWDGHQPVKNEHSSGVRTRSFDYDDESTDHAVQSQSSRRDTQGYESEDEDVVMANILLSLAKK